MTGDPDEVIDRAEQRRETIREHYLPAAEWFLEEGGLNPRTEVVADLAAHLDVDREVANLAVGHLVEDDADPVQQVVDPIDGKYVGVIDHAEHDSFYAFDRYDDVDGRQRRAVCAHCVHAEREVADIAHFTRPPDEYDLGRARLALALHYHVDHQGCSLPAVLEEDLGVDPAAFADRNGLAGTAAIGLRDVTRRLDDDPALAGALGDAADRLGVPDVEIEPGASLVSGTTIGGNTAWHAGNDGPGSGLVADTLDGFEAERFIDTFETDTGNFYYSQDTLSVTFSTPLPTTAYSAQLYAPKTGEYSYMYFQSWNLASGPTYSTTDPFVTTTVPDSSDVRAIFTGDGIYPSKETFIYLKAYLYH